MATATRGRSFAAQEHRNEHHRTSLWAQLARFVGLYLSPGLGLLTAWLIHLWVVGIGIHWGRIDWEMRPSPAAVTVAVCLTTLLTVLVAYLAWQFAEHRKPVIRNSLAGSVIALGLLFAINVGTGPSFAWSPLFVFAAWAVAVIWSIARLDVTRNDKRTDEQEPDGFLEKIGLKGWRGKGTPILNDKGERIATKVEFEHAEGDTVDQLQDAVPAFESATGSPSGLSSATGSDRADRSTLRVMHVDPLAEMVCTPAPSSPGGSISEPLDIGTYSTGERVQMKIAGKPHAGLVSSVLWMGMTGTGKTTAENKAISEMETRRDVVIFYANKAKGMQDVRPIIPGIEAALIADDADQGALYREAMKQLKRILTYRSNQLGLFGVSEWTAECYSSPPWRTDEDGRRVRMEPMPFLFAHIGEADAILEEDRGESVYLASKGRSVGLATSWSLQRADYQKMPTGLRFNLGTALCFGLGDEDSVEFALPKHVIKAGAHPDEWRNRKQGYFYYIGQSIDERLFPIFARADGLGPDGGSLPEALLKQNLEWAPRMAKLDAGSVAATNGWWEKTVAETDVLRARLLRGGPAGTPAGTTPQVATPAGPQVTDPADLTDEEIAEIDEQTRRELRDEMKDITHVEGVELYPQIDGGGATAADATREHDPAPDDEGLDWTPAEPAARDRPAALAGLRAVVVKIANDPAFRDRSDATGRTYRATATQVRELWPYRSRPFFAEALRDMSTGAVDGPDGYVLSRDDRGGFVIQRVPDGNAQ